MSVANAAPVVLITGGTSGIGAAAARAFSLAGYHVAFTGRRDALGKALEDALPNSLFLPADHRIPADCEACVAATIAHFGAIDVLFNNAGVVFLGTVAETGDADLEDVLALNVTATFRMIRLVLPGMLARKRGVIINNASDWGIVGGRRAVAYCASKGAVISLTRAIALDHAREGVRVLAVCPGDTFVERWHTEGYGRGAGQGPIDRGIDLHSSDEIPMGRVGGAEEVAKVVVFLASEGASFMTGCAVPVDGGNTAQ